MDNPYSSPTVDTLSTVEAAKSVSDRTLHNIARKTFLAWERLRIIYIVLLGLLTLLLAGSSLVRFRTIVMIVEGAIIANVAFFAGPTVETYLGWLGYEGKWVRWFLFVGGTLLTMLLAVATMASKFVPD